MERLPRHGEKRLLVVCCDRIKHTGQAGIEWEGKVGVAFPLVPARCLQLITLDVITGAVYNTRSFYRVTLGECGVTLSQRFRHIPYRLARDSKYKVMAHSF